MGDGSASLDDALLQDNTELSSNPQTDLTSSGSGEPQHVSSGDQREQQRMGEPKKDYIVPKYEANLTRVRRAAVFTVATYSFNKFLGLCALTVASVVVLGGFVPNLDKRDFYTVSLLLLLEAFRLAVAAFFANIVTRKLVYRSTNPITLRYDDSDRQKIITIARIAGQAFQVLLVAFGIVLSLRHFRHPSGDGKLDSFDALQCSLRIFYTFVVLNGIVSLIRVFHSILLVPLWVTSYSLRRYYDKVVWRGMSKGLLLASDFDILKFAFEVQTEEYRRNIRAPVVRALYKDLLEYLFWHNKGFAAARIALDSSDSSEQEAAANIVGLWTELDRKPSRLRLQVRLLSKLADMVDNQETGRAAVVSFERLANKDPEGVLQVRSGGLSLVEILTKRIEEVVNAGKYDKTIVYAKALMPLLKVSNAIDAEHGGNSLVGMLDKVLKGDCLIRTKAVARIVIRILTENREPNMADAKSSLIPLVRQQHILRVEKTYLEELVGSTSVVDDWISTQTKLVVRDGKAPDAAPLSVHKGTHIGAIVAIIFVGLLAWRLNDRVPF